MPLDFFINSLGRNFFFGKERKQFARQANRVLHTVRIGQFANIAVYVKLMTPATAGDETMFATETDSRRKREREGEWDSN